MIVGCTLVLALIVFALFVHQRREAARARQEIERLQAEKARQNSLRSQQEEERSKAEAAAKTSQETEKLRKFHAAAKAAIEAIESLDAALDANVPQSDYAKRVADATVIVDRFVREWPEERTLSACTAVNQAMLDYYFANSMWNHRKEFGDYTPADRDLGKSIASEFPGAKIGNVVSFDLARQMYWIRGRKRLNHARDMIRDLAVE